jgi:hypothetical protein
MVDSTDEMVELTLLMKVETADTIALQTVDTIAESAFQPVCQMLDTELRNDDTAETT